LILHISHLPQSCKHPIFVKFAKPKQLVYPPFRSRLAVLQHPPSTKLNDSNLGASVGIDVHSFDQLAHKLLQMPEVGAAD
jgi:hypothetical protein